MSRQQEPRNMAERLDQVCAAFSPSVAAMIREVVNTRPGAAQPIIDLVWAVDEEVSEQQILTAAEQFERVVSHFPGLAPALFLTKSHIEGYIPACKPYNLRTARTESGCVLPPYDWEDGMDASALPAEQIEE